MISLTSSVNPFNRSEIWTALIPDIYNTTIDVFQSYFFETMKKIDFAVSKGAARRLILLHVWFGHSFVRV